MSDSCSGNAQANDALIIFRHYLGELSQGFDDPDDEMLILRGNNGWHVNWKVGLRTETEGSHYMTNYVNQDEIEDLHRRIAFAEACSEPLILTKCSIGFAKVD